MWKNIDRILKITSTIGFLLISLALILITNNKPAIGGEISIYTALPVTIWILLFGSIACGISIVIQQVFTKEYRKTNWWLIGLLIVIIVNSIILQLFVFRGYVIYGKGDILSHVGYTLDIINSGKISTQNIYPITHILITEISLISGLHHIKVVNYIITLFIICFNISTYILAKIIFIDSKKVILAVLASTVLLFSYANYQVLPTVLSAYFIIFILYTYFKIDEKNSIEIRILFVLFSILYPFFHPLTSLVLIISFISMDISRVLFILITSDKKLESSTKIHLNRSLITLIIFIMWLSRHLDFWDNNMRQITQWFIREATAPVIAENIGGLFERLNLQLIDIIQLYLKMYGSISVFLILSLIAIIIILRRALFFRDRDVKNLFILLTWFVLMFLLLMLNLFATFLDFSYWRVLFIMVIPSTILVAFAIDELFIKKYEIVNSDNKFKYLNVFTVIVILLFSSVNGVFNTYPSPYILQANQQVTQMNINGIIWLYNHNNQTKIFPLKMMTYRFADALLGVDERIKRKDIVPYEPGNQLLIPYHFGYDHNKSLGQLFSQNIYIPISKFDKIFYNEVYPQLNEFNENDFQKLNYDQTIAKVYSNSELEFYFVNSTKST